LRTQRQKKKKKEWGTRQSGAENIHIEGRSHVRRLTAKGKRRREKTRKKSECTRRKGGECKVAVKTGVVDFSFEVILGTVVTERPGERDFWEGCRM